MSEPMPEWGEALPYICIYQLAALIEHRAVASARQRRVIFTTSHNEAQLRQSMIDAVPITQFRDVAEATPKTTA